MTTGPARVLELLWRSGEPPRRRGPRPGLSVDEVVAGAIALADREGLEALTMRRLAESLGVKPMALYTYVPGKAELIDLMLDAVYLEMPRQPWPAGQRWRDRLARVAADNRELYRAHPWAAAPSASRPPLGPGLMAKYEHELRALEDAGLGDVETDAALSFLLDFVRSAAVAANAAGAARAGSGMSDEQWWEANAPLLERVLDPDRYPTAARVGTAAGAEQGGAYSPDRAWEFGLERTLDGLEALIRRRPADGPAALEDESTFTALFERHRRELQVHCYRMLGSLEDSEDLVQETFLRAWRSRRGFGADGRFAFRAWLYRIATNACLDLLRGRPRRVVPQEVAAPADPSAPLPPPADLPWLEPYPDRLLEPAAPGADEPGAVVVARETIELAFIAAIQHLPPRQRAALILRDVLGWPAKDTAALLEMSVAAVNSALQRARETLRDRLGDRRTDWERPSEPSDEERELLRRYVDAHERADVDGLAALLREDALLTMPPHAVWFAGRDAILAAAGQGFDPEFGELRTVAAAANRQPAAAHYLRRPGETEYRPLALDVLRLEGGRVAEIASFVSPELFTAFGLPPSLR